MASESPYVLDNNARQSRRVLDDLSAILDDFTRFRLAGEIPTGGRCLEIGAGNGSVAYWLADMVGSGGEVIATDIKPHHIADRPRLSVVKHDIATMAGLDGKFYLIHAGLVLAHLPERRKILRWLAGLLNPGGTILVEEWGEINGRLLVSPRSDAANLYCRYQHALLEVFRAQGNDPGWAMQVADAMTAVGLVDWLAEHVHDGTFLARVRTAVDGLPHPLLSGTGLWPKYRPSSSAAAPRIATR